VDPEDKYFFLSLLGRMRGHRDRVRVGLACTNALFVLNKQGAFGYPADETWKPRILLVFFSWLSEWGLIRGKDVE
jgi:hypothetical protein